MNKKLYFDPEMKVVELQLERALLVGSGEDGPGGMNDDGSANTGGEGGDGDF